MSTDERPSGARPVLADDTGTSLLELVVAMAILTIFMGIFTTSMLMMTRGTNKVQAISQSVDQGNTAFMRLDRTVRYATGISDPTSTATGWDVELSSTLPDGTPQCTQLRTTTGGKMERSTWQPSGAGYKAGTLTPWRPLASEVTNSTVSTGDDVPFTIPVVAEGTSSEFRRLRVVLVTTSGAAGSKATSRTAATFTAQNSTAAAKDVCAQVPVGTPR